MENEQIIIFDNLIQSTDTLGVYAPVKIKIQTTSQTIPFTQKNETGSLRECKNHIEADKLGAKSAKQVLDLLAS